MLFFRLQAERAYILQFDQLASSGHASIFLSRFEVPDRTLTLEIHAANPAMQAAIGRKSQGSPDPNMLVVCPHLNSGLLR